MIEKNSNVIKDPKIKRLVEYSADNKQINVLDNRFIDAMTNTTLP